MNRLQQLNKTFKQGIHLLGRVFLTVCCCTFIATTVTAQELCNEDSQATLDSCIADAKASCEAAVPECDATAITPEAAIALLENRCGTCESNRNFGRFNSCLKRVRNGLRKLGSLDDAVKEALKTERSDCKAEKKGNKNKDTEDEDEEDQ